MTWDAKNSIEQKKNCSKNTEPANSVITPKTATSLMQKDSNTTLKTKISGIYKIVNKVNGKYYVGSSNDIHSRWYAHKHHLKHKKHWNAHLQKAYDKYGCENFIYLIIETNIEHNCLLKVEQKHLDIAKLEKCRCYNIGFVAGRVEMTPEIRKKISLSSKGRISPRKGIKWTDEQKLRMSQIKMGTVISLEHRKKLSLINKNNDYFYDMIPHHFQNRITKDKFFGLRRELSAKYKIASRGIGRIVRGERKTFKNWLILPR